MVEGDREKRGNKHLRRLKIAAPFRSYLLAIWMDFYMKTIGQYISVHPLQTSPSDVSPLIRVNSWSKFYLICLIA